MLHTRPFFYDVELLVFLSSELCKEAFGQILRKISAFPVTRLCRLLLDPTTPSFRDSYVPPSQRCIGLPKRMIFWKTGFIIDEQCYIISSMTFIMTPTVRLSEETRKA